ncbi:uncharacterized protein LAESUDRAFT_702874 [Laetiporus sulphureus 93-53]|uniref:G-protein coupled receptors family 1 profile domain-containing protein n=1 Tax=Laetiporus sulphureus 93-53 TaxID=1314785 RepID=A0A165DHY2_9APHY|nr:uncharacterized protein LAESUDRAFT_702874 [Laetiporus sulphureus 93-53]KZT04920.1 hypothetical protein LAESUDRAFT_702874 [Laetiporus sulphureus 93-53]
MAEVSVLSAILVSVCLNSFLYGVFLVLCIASLWLFLRYERSKSGGRSSISLRRYSISLSPTFIACVCLLLSVTMYWVLIAYQLFQAFVLYDGGRAPTEFYADFSQTTAIVQNCVLVFTIIVGDAILVYRLWVIWVGNMLVMMVPALSLLGLIVSGIAGTYLMSTMSLEDQSLVLRVDCWVTGNCVFTLCTNVYCTSLISWKIWRTDAFSNRVSGASRRKALAILVESAAIYTCWTIFYFVTIEVHSNLEYLVNNLTCPIVGIAFMLINVRVGLGWSRRGRQQPSQSTTLEAGHSQASGEPFRRPPLTINITRTIHRDHDPVHLPGKLSDEHVGIELDVMAA